VDLLSSVSMIVFMVGLFTLFVGKPCILHVFMVPIVVSGIGF